jgi:cytochrome o ubiquinol oxidase subunit 3
MMDHNPTRSEMIHEAEADDRTMFGFWVYLMTDLLMFAVLFAVFAVLRDSTNGGHGAVDLLNPDLALAETLLLLTSSFTVGIGMIAAWQGKKDQVMLWFGTTFLLGVAFLGIELYEFYELIHEGYTMQSSAFLSAFFVLLSTHGLHIASGLLWMAVILVFVAKRGLSRSNVRKLALLSLFWHFLDIVWIFIFTVVYLMPFIGV